jgi:hypothetical protein
MKGFLNGGPADSTIVELPHNQLFYDAPVVTRTPGFTTLTYHLYTSNGTTVGYDNDHLLLTPVRIPDV